MTGSYGSSSKEAQAELTVSPTVSLVAALGGAGVTVGKVGIKSPYTVMNEILRRLVDSEPALTDAGCLISARDTFHDQENRLRLLRSKGQRLLRPRPRILGLSVTP